MRIVVKVMLSLKELCGRGFALSCRDFVALCELAERPKVVEVGLGMTI